MVLEQGEMGPPSVPVRRGARLREAALAGLLYVALTLVLAWPLSFHPRSMAAPADPDTDLFVWTLAWNTHALVSDPRSVFDANIYYPHARTLAFSENLIGSTLVAAPVLWLTGDHVLALNLVALSAVVLCGLGAFVLARRLGIGVHGAIVCGLVFAFAPARFMRFGQIHLATVQWVPFCLAYLHAYLEDGRRRHLWLALGFFSLQTLTSGHGAAFLVVAVFVVLGYRLAAAEPIAPLRRLRDCGIVGALLLVPAALVYVPYRQVRLDHGFTRAVIHWPNLESFLASPTIAHRHLVSLLPSLEVYAHAKAFLFPGVLPLLLAALALCARRDRDTAVTAATPPTGGPSRGAWLMAAWIAEAVALVALTLGAVVALDGPIRWRVDDVLVFTARRAERPIVLGLVAIALRIALAGRVPFEPLARVGRLRARWIAWGRGVRGSVRAPYLLLTLLCVSLAAGPPFSLWPSINHLPGLSSIRVPSRFMILATLGLAVLAGRGFERLATRRTAAAIIVCAGLALEFAALPFPGARPYRVEIPAVDRWLASRPAPFVVAEFPSNGYSERLQSTYMLHSMAHWQKTVHGHSGWRTPLHIELYRNFRTFPDAVSLRRLAELGVDYAVVHRDLYHPAEWPEVEDRLHAFAACLRLEHEDGDGRVYAVTVDAPTCPVIERF